MDQPGDVRTSRTLLNDFSMITPAPRAFPDLRRRAAFAEPEPQVAASTNLQALSQSAQQAIQQASDAVIFFFLTCYTTFLPCNVSCLTDPNRECSRD